MRMNDYYKTLGVERNATPEDIKKAYRKMAARHHPDRGGSKEEFQKIEEAYRVLSDPQSRQQHDNPNPFGGFGGFPHDNQFHEFNFNDIFSQAFGGGFGQPRRPQKAQYRTTIWVTLEQVFTGAEHQVQLGTGREVYKINVPVGIEDGQAVRYDNLIPDAILIVEYRIHQHPTLRRKGNDLYSTLKLSFLELVAGTQVKVTTISGSEVSVSVPPNTQSGTTLRLPGKGMKNGQHQGYTGDHYLLLEGIIPDTISDRLLSAINQELNR